jgi:TP901 family phage tail tape measure protein
MADVNATFVYDADFTSAVSQVRVLSRELSILNNSFNSLDKDARKVRDRFAEVFKADVGDLGAFSARTVDITSNIDNFGKALDRNKLKLREYGREATRAFKANSNARKLAEDQVRRTRAELVDLGMDATGRRKGILVTPLRLDMSDMQTQMEVARKQFSIFNKLVNDGATQLINWGKNTQWAGRQLTVGLTVPMTIFATTTIKAFNDVDRELTRFQKVYGSDLVGSTTQATNAIRQQVQALAVDIAGSYGIAAKETAGLAADLAATGLEGQKLLDSIKQTTRLSVLGEIDRQDAMKTTLSLQNAFNMSTQELADSINFLNAVENQTSLSLQDLTEAIPKVGPVVRALGGDVKDLSVLMVAMKEGGINAAEGANALKSGLASLINPTKAGSEVAKQYGIDLENIVKKNKGQLLPTVLEFQQSMSTLDDLGKAKIIEQLFGKYQFARISALFDNLNTAGSQTQQVIELMSASNSDLARIANAEIKTLTESASMRFQRSMEAIKAALLPVGEAIVNSVLPFMERFAGVLDKVVSFAQNLPGPIKSFLKVVSGLTLVAGPIIMMAGVLGNFAGYIVKGAMAFVNLGRIMRGLPTEKFSLLDDVQIAAAKATDTVTISIEKQKSAMIGLNKVMMDYYSLVNRQAAKTPNLFNAPIQAVAPGTQSRSKPIKRQKGGPAWVPGSGSGDKIPALLEPGEFVINRNAAKQYGGVLEDMNSGVPRFQSGGKIPGYRLGRTALAEQHSRDRAARLRTTNPVEASSINVPETSGNSRRVGRRAGLKYSNPRRIFGATKAENQLLNDLFQAGRHANSSPSRVALRNAILAQIDQMSITPEQKTKLRRAIEINRNFADVDDQMLFSNLLRETISNPTNAGILDEISTDLKAKLIATMLIPEKRVVSRVSSLSDTESGISLSPTFSSTRSIRGAFGPSGERARDESFIAAFGGRQSAERAFESVISRMESEYNIPRSISEKYLGVLKTEGAHGLQSGGIIPGFKLGKTKRTRKRLPKKERQSKYRVMDQWIWDANNVRQEPDQFEQLKSLLGPSQSGFEATRGTVLGSPTNKELPYTQQAAIVKAIKEERYEDLYGMELNFRGPSSYSSDRGVDVSKFISSANPLLSAISRNWQLSGSIAGSLKMLRAGRAKARKQKLQPGTPEYNLLLAQSGWGSALTTTNRLKTFEEVIDYYRTQQVQNNRQRKKLIPDEVFQQLLIQEMVGEGVQSLNLQDAFGAVKPKMRHSNARLKAEKEVLLGNRQSRITGVASDIRTKLPVLVTESGVQNKQAGGPAWVPGNGEGDRVPAMLEPGEFVVNKKAAMKYGGILEDMNWNLAPRFARGKTNKGKSSFDRQKVVAQPDSYEVEDEVILDGPQTSQSVRIPGMKTGAISGGLMAASMAASFLPMNTFTENLNKAVMAISAFTGVLSAAQTMMPAKAGGGAAGGMAGMLKNPMAAITRLGPMLLNPWVLATAAIGATVFAVYKYRDSIKQAGKDGKAIFDSQTEAAKELGIELKTTAQNMEAISGNFNPLQPTIKAPSILTVEQQDAIAGTEQNKRLIEQIKNSQDAQSILMTQYSRMILDGMMPEEAMAIVKLIAERAGKAQDFFKAAPEMNAIGNQENPQKQFQMAMGSFTASIANLTPEAAPANETNWQQLFSGSNVSPQEKEKIKMGVSTALEAVQMAPDLSSFINGMDTLTKSVTELEKAGKGLGLEAIKEFAKTKYGEDSSFFKAFDTLPDNLNTVENKLMLITASSAGINLDEFLMDGKFAQEEIDIINQKLKQTGINAEIDLRIKDMATAQLAKIEKQSIAVQSSYDSAIAKNESLVDAENERYKKAGKAHQAFIKARQKEIDVIEKQADSEIESINKTTKEYLDALNKGDRQSAYLAQQRQTAISGLGALAGGDIFGFMQSQEQMQASATSYAYDNEIAAVEEKRDKEVAAIEEVKKKRTEALQAEIDKRQEAAEKEDEKHERRLNQLEAQRIAAEKNYKQSITELRGQEQALQNISTYTGPDFAKMVSGYEATASMAAKVAAAEVAITALSNGATVDAAIKAGQDYLGKHALTSSAYNNKILKDSGYQGAGMIITKASGGYISGPGTGTSDSIPARLSNGEYVVKSSSVNKYGVGMLNSINEQKFAKGGEVGGGEVLDDYARVSYGSKTFNARTVRMLKKAEEKYGSPFEFYQGSYSTKIKASMGTHDGGGAVDIKPPSNITKALAALSQAGFWAKWRDKMKPPHIHAIAYGDKELSAAARKQLGLPADYEGDPVEGSQDSMGNIATVLAALGTNIATVNTVRSKGVRGLMNPRQFGGSMTMNKPYLVGERGPEVFMPYGSGGKISPVSYDVPQNTTGTSSQVAAITGGITTQESNNVYYNVNVDASATNNPRDVANYVIRALKQEENRRSFSRRIG